MLKQGVKAGLILLAGRMVPRTGGIIVCRGRQPEVTALAQNDPFVTEGVATIAVVELAASVAADALAPLLDDARADRLRGGEPSLGRQCADGGGGAGCRDHRRRRNGRSGGANRAAGVGAFGACAAALRAIPDMVATLERRVRDGSTPFLGICVGMQLLAAAG